MNHNCGKRNRPPYMNNITEHVQSKFRRSEQSITVFSRLGPPPSQEPQSPKSSSLQHGSLHGHYSPTDSNNSFKDIRKRNDCSNFQSPTKRNCTVPSIRRASFELPLNDDQCLHEIANSEPEKLARTLTKRGVELKDVLSSKNTTAGSTTLTLLVKIFARLGVLLNEREPGSSKSPATIVHLPDRDRSKLNRVMKYLIEEDTIGGFYLSLSNYLCQMPIEISISKRKSLLQFLLDTIAMLNVLLDIYPSQASTNLTVIDTCIGTTVQLAQQQIIFQNVAEKAQHLLQKRNSIRAQSYESNCEKPHTQEFSIILPSPEELHKDVLDLRPNHISEPFPDAANYLVIQFRLLQEDFLRPLRSALKGACDPEEDGECENIMVYQNVHFDKGKTYTFAGIAYKISFQTPRKINWNRSKKLMHGALVCLSMDGFNTLCYATVVERDVQDLSNGVIGIQLQGCSLEDELSLSASTEFSMIESPGYYTAYAPVLKRLHRIKPDELPFKGYLVDLNREIDVPNYIGDMEPSVDLKGVVCKCKWFSSCEHENVEILNQEAWDALQTPLLDPSQKKALHMALTKEIALIQGPPGTGKTYVGLKLIQALLKNDSLWKNTLSMVTGTVEKSPIVVICYTNHALDQFLEGMLSLLNSEIQIIRIGSRSKSEAISHLNLQRFVRSYCREHHIYNPMRSWLEKQKFVEALDELISGRFNQENCQIYCYFLSSYVLEDLESSCGIKMLHFEDSSEQFASWLDPVVKHKIALSHQDQKEEIIDSLFRADEYDRRDMSKGCDEVPEVHDIFRALKPEGIQKFVEKFGKVEPLSEKRAQEYLFKDRAEGFVRLQLFKYCLMQLHLHHSAELKFRVKKKAKYDEEMELIKLRCLQRADVIGLTTTAAARDNTLISQVQSKILIVEEAAEVLEPQLIAALTKNTQHLILIGDHKQLRPKTNDHTIGREYKLEISMFERLVTNEFPHATLTVQHRMRPEMSAVVSKHIYNGILRDHESTLSCKDIKGMKFNMFFINHTKPEEPNPELKSPSNDHEATFLAALCYYLLQQGYSPERITVITPYIGQMFKLRERFRELHISDVRITPIDGYQGEENYIILLSLVRSKKLGFVKDENRICVALSRAKCGLYCIGNFTLFKRCKLWSDILNDINSNGCLGNSLPLQCVRHQNETLVSCAADFDQVSDGGCKEQCNVRLKCNHVCQSKCHPSDEIHKSPCQLPCPKRCDAGHRCKRACFQDCGKCEERVEKAIEKCQHKQIVPCYMDPKHFICQMECRKVLKCGHVCKKKCGEKCTTECRMLVEKVLSCGHTAQEECHVDEEDGAKRCKHPCEETLACEHKCSGTCGRCRQGRLHAPCREKCTRVLLCGHPCTSYCSKNCPQCSKECKYVCHHGPCGHKCSSPCRPCPHHCEWKCPHFQCFKNCGEMCDRPRCLEKCPKPLSCGHSCIGVCGEPCPTLCRECISRDEFETQIPIFFGNEHDESARFVPLEDCGHVIEVTALDTWMDQQDEHNMEIKWKCCPQCRTPVMKTARYSNVLKQIQVDMNIIKERKLNFLSTSERVEMRQGLLRIQLDDLYSERFISRDVKLQWKELVEEKFNDFILHKSYTLYLTAGCILMAKESLKDLLRNPSLDSNSEEYEHVSRLLSQARDFLDWIKQNKHKEITDQMKIDINAERRRILLLEAMCNIKHSFLIQNIEVEEEDEKLLEKISLYATNGAKIPKLTDDSAYRAVLNSLQSMPKKYRVPLTLDERKMIIKAIGAKPGSWYKCPNGHYYQIGECGGAMQTSKCPECGSMIGGRSHQLLSSNRHAGEFDQSGHAAWSEAANLQNFALGDII